MGRLFWSRSDSEYSKGQNGNTLSVIKWHSTMESFEGGKWHLFSVDEGRCCRQVGMEFKGGFHGRHGIWRTSPFGQVEMEKLYIVGGGKSKGTGSLMRIRSRVSSGNFWFRAESGLSPRKVGPGLCLFWPRIMLPPGKGSVSSCSFQLNCSVWRW